MKWLKFSLSILFPGYTPDFDTQTENAHDLITFINNECDYLDDIFDILMIEKRRILHPDISIISEIF